LLLRFFLFLTDAWLLKAVWFIVLFATQARITIAAVLVWQVYGLFRLSNSRELIRNATILLIGGLFLSFFFILNSVEGNLDLHADETVVGRFASLLNPLTIQEPIDFYLKLPLIRNSQEFRDLDQALIMDELEESNYDASAFSRFSRWAIAIKAVQSHGMHQFFIGVGPSFFGPALDGAFLRLFVECGLIGLLIYVLFLKSVVLLFRDDWRFLAYVVTLMITGVFIDIFFAYKAMSLLWIAIAVHMKHQALVQQDVD
jgi:hypothetical protein